MIDVALELNTAKSLQDTPSADDHGILHAEHLDLLHVLLTAIFNKDI